MSKSYQKLPFLWPHAGCVRFGRFRRSWVVPELTEANWDHSGVLYRDAEGTVVYGTVVRFEQYGVSQWQIDRELFVDGRFEPGPRDRHPTTSDAIDELMAEVRVSRARWGPVARRSGRRDSGWVIFSRPRRGGR